MEIRQQFTVAQPATAVWRSLGDVRLVVSCLPGAEVVTVSDDQCDVTGRITARVGPVSATFSGSARLARDDATMTGTLEGSGVDSKNGSRTAVRLDYAVKPADEGRAALVRTVASVTLSGIIAQFGKSGLINDVATQITKQFAGRLEEALAQAGAAVPNNVQSPATGPAPKPKPVPPAELRPLQILWRLVVFRVRRLFRAGA